MSGAARPGRPARLRHRRGRRQVRRHGRAEAGALERADVQQAAFDAEPDATVLHVVEVAMGLQERLRLAARTAGETVDEVMAVALDMRQAEQADQREVL